MLKSDIQCPCLAEVHAATQHSGWRPRVLQSGRTDALKKVLSPKAKKKKGWDQQNSASIVTLAKTSPEYVSNLLHFYSLLDFAGNSQSCEKRSQHVVVHLLLHVSGWASGGRLHFPGHVCFQAGEDFPKESVASSILCHVSCNESPFSPKQPKRNGRRCFGSFDNSHPKKRTRVFLSACLFLPPSLSRVFLSFSLCHLEKSSSHRDSSAIATVSHVVLSSYESEITCATSREGVAL